MSVRLTILYREESKKPEKVECSYIKTRDGFLEMSWSEKLFKRRYIPADLIKEVVMESDSEQTAEGQYIRRKK